MNGWELFGLFIIIVIVALLIWWNLFRGKQEKVVTGGGGVQFENITNDIAQILGGADGTDIADRTYTLLAPTLILVGETRNIEQYLLNMLDITNVEISQHTKNKYNVPEDHKKFYELLIVAAEATMPRDEYELISILDLRYCWFLSGDKGKVLLKARPAKAEYNQLIAKIIEEEMNSASMYESALKEKLIKRFTKIGQKYKCFTIDISNISAKNKKLSRSEIVGLDQNTLRYVVRNLLKCEGENRNLASLTKSPTALTIAEKLSAIDLLDFYPREPYLVKSFIERIKREINLIEYNTNYWKDIIPLGKDVLRSSLRELVLRDAIRDAAQKNRNDLILDEEGPAWQPKAVTVVPNDEVPYAPEKVSVPVGAIAEESKNSPIAP